MFKGPNGELLLDPRFLKPCDARLQMCKVRSSGPAKPQTEATTVAKGYSDNSSDSGYDESSNQGLIVENSFKKEVQVSSIVQINAEVAMVN